MEMGTGWCLFEEGRKGGREGGRERQREGGERGRQVRNRESKNELVQCSSILVELYVRNMHAFFLLRCGLTGPCQSSILILQLQLSQA